MPENVAPFPLARMQRWMQSVIVHPGGVAAGLVSVDAEAEIDSRRLTSLISTTGELSPVERLEIYADMFPLRMRDALASDYPALARLLGEERFDELVRDYVHAFPSRSYTLNRLGDRLPDFVSGWGPARGRVLRTDLARLELAMTEVFDAEETPPLPLEALAGVPAEVWPGLRLRPVAALRLLELSTNAGVVFDAFRDGEPLPPGRRAPRGVVVFRRDYAVRRRRLSRPAFALLVELVAGNPLGEALERVLGDHRVSPSAMTAWARDWVAEGYFAGYSFSSSEVEP